MAGLVNFIVKDKLSDKGIMRACEVLKEYDQILLNFNIEKKDVHIFATASLRNVINSKEVLDIIKEETGYSIDLLSGEEEAILDFKGATKVINKDSGLLIDIGGGSTEIVGYKNKEIVFAVSMPIGSLNTYVKFVKKIIPKPQEREEIKLYTLEQLKKLNIKKDIYINICGVGGTIRAASKLNNHMFKEGKPISQGDKLFKVSDAKEILKEINNSHKKTLKPVLQTIPDRIHTIIPGLLILETIADYFNCEEITVSKYGIREGYLIEKILNQ
jgi:exopolyphosphatase/guanosine-5'-triphosphate,3'-diphosphate pyrophosphatase